MKPTLKFMAIPLAVGALVFAGCGSDDSSDDSTSTETTTTQTQPADNSEAAASQVLSLAADPDGQLAYDKTDLTAKAGKVRLDFTNESSVGHDVVIEDSSGNEVAATDIISGQSTSIDFDVKPGKYTFYCSLPGHEAAGMKGTLTVN
jgi:plastocyanin